MCPQVRKEVLDARYQKSTSHLMFSLVNRHCVIVTAFIIGNQYRMIIIAFVIENHCSQSRGKVLCTLLEKMIKIKLTILFYSRVTIFHHCLSESCLA